MKFQKFLRLVLINTARIIGELVCIGLVLVVPCFVIYLPGLVERLTIPKVDIIISLMQLVGFCFYLLIRKGIWGRMIERDLE